MLHVRVLIVHNETTTRDGGDWHGDRFEGFIPSLSRDMRPRTELRFIEDNEATTPEAIANRVWALANGLPDAGDESLSEGYYKWARRSLSVGDLLSIIVTRTDSIRDLSVGDEAAPVWLSIEGLGMKRHTADQIPSSALPNDGLPVVDIFGAVF